MNKHLRNKSLQSNQCLMNLLKKDLLSKMYYLMTVVSKLPSKEP